MAEALSTQEQQLCQFLKDMPGQHKYRYTKAASNDLITSLFMCMAGGRQDYIRMLFPNGMPRPDAADPPRLRDAQGAVEGAEYSESARGKACGHIFKQGEASYSCRTCAADDTCCLCARCFEATDHTGHMVRISMSAGNTGCCDCGDLEAWRVPMFCTIHSMLAGKGHEEKGKEAGGPPADLIAGIQMTVSRVFDYMCDVISCAPEQLRQAKSVESIERDELMSRLTSTYGGGDLPPDDSTEYAVVLWNDEKHTVDDVRDQVARACRLRGREASEKAFETDLVGRSILMFDKDLPSLLEVAEILEKIRVTITIRSARDTFREQMCGTMIEWLSDIAGSSVAGDNHILRNMVCEEMLKPWRRGSPAVHADVGTGEIDDEDKISREVGRDQLHAEQMRIIRMARQAAARQALAATASDSNDDDDDDAGENTPSSGEMDDDDDDDNDNDDEDVLMIDTRVDADDIAMDWRNDAALEMDEATLAGFPPPPPPPPVATAAVQRHNARERDLTPSDSDTAEPLIAPNVYAKANLDIPKTPGNAKGEKERPPNPGRYWLGTPAAYTEHNAVSPAEDLFKRVRLDWMILFDLRMWKHVRNDLRSLYLSTIVTVPEFKRVLGLRFAGLYTTLAQLYLIGDREPDHSIINLSLQMLTTPSITAEVVERGNFLTSLMAILYTFLTTRQVGHPWDVASNAILAFDTGSVTNRRMYHFFMDLKYVFSSPHVQGRLRTEERYIMQFLDLVKLHQGICPNIRAIGEHVEYETDTWISAALITREINKLCRQFSEAFRDARGAEAPSIMRAIRLAARAVLLNSIGAERARFSAAETKDEVKFKTLTGFEFDQEQRSYEVVKFVVEEQHISFHHALHYTLSWLIECGKAMDVQQLRTLLTFKIHDLLMKPKSMGRKQLPKREMQPEDLLMAAFDYPLRVCAWLAQMKAGMWVRNGMSLRHQASTYRGVGQRDVSHQRDILLLQTALVVCDPNRVLASIVDRFGMEQWITGFFEVKSKNQDDTQHLDVAEDMIHLLIILLSDRHSLICSHDEPDAPILTMRRDLTHVLCFKPLSFSEITNKLPDKIQEHDDFHRVLAEMTNFKPAEGVSDVGTFELKPECIEGVDPYIAHYNKNQREESETAYKKWMAKKTGKPVEEIVYEPKLRQIPSGVFSGLTGFTGTGVFAQIIYYCLLYPLVCQKYTPNVPITRVETYLHVVLHLVLIAVTEDNRSEESLEHTPTSSQSFVFNALTSKAISNILPDSPRAKTIVSLLEVMSTNDDLKSCHPKIDLILRRMRQKRATTFESVYSSLGLNVDRINTASPASSAADEERDRKKKAALDRQARVMAQFQQQQKTFLEKQGGGIDWGQVDDTDEDDDPFIGKGKAAAEHMEEHRKYWKYPAGTCILCQEETDDKRLYGTFAFLAESCVLRQTDLQDPDFVREAANTPASLDRSAEAIRPFGIASENRRVVEKINSAGQHFLEEQQIVARGFPRHLTRAGPVSVGCGHIMHFSCFETYFNATTNRHKNQVARHHPESPEKMEFVCPLCKALGNAFLPIVWKDKEESYPGLLLSAYGSSMTKFLMHEMATNVLQPGWLSTIRPLPQFDGYIQSSFTNNLAERSRQLREEAWEASPGPVPSTPWMDIYPPSDSSSSRPTSMSEPTGYPWMTRELATVYRRLRDTLRKNGLQSRYRRETDTKKGHTSSRQSSMSGDGDESPSHFGLRNELAGGDVLARAVGFSISATEIQQRGVAADYGSTFLEKIPQLSLTHLRILCETTTTFLSVGSLRRGGENRVYDEYKHEIERQHCQLFISVYLKESAVFVRRPVDEYAPLLSMDTFVFLCETLFGAAQAYKWQTMHVVTLLYLAELVKLVFHMGHNIPATVWLDRFVNRPEDLSPELNNFADFVLAVVQMDMQERQDLDASGGNVDEGKNNRAFLDQPTLPHLDSIEGYYQFIRRYALVFVRKCLILLHVKDGVDFNAHMSPHPELDELERLTEALRLPTFDEMCTSLTPLGVAHGWPNNTFSMKQLVSGWIKHHTLWPASADPAVFDPSRYTDRDVQQGWGNGSGRLASALVSHPGIPELLGLPKNYDALLEASARKKCPSTGKDMSDPMLCLHCGEIFCGQASCCRKTEYVGQRKHEIGGAQQHGRKCQKSIGLFVNIRRGCIFHLSSLSGSFSNTPYVDRYGEVDMGLRHNRQLFLSQKRYDSTLRQQWLSHGVPSFISRKLEADINNGGWETI